MPKIYIKNKDITIETSPIVSVLNTLMRFGVAIQHKCGGKALCGTCRYRVIEGMDKIRPMQEREKLRLEAAGHPEGYRLACQTYIFGDIVIELPDYQ